jgi:hypothetical protein
VDATKLGNEYDKTVQSPELPQPQQDEQQPNQPNNNHVLQNSGKMTSSVSPPNNQLPYDMTDISPWTPSAQRAMARTTFGIEHFGYGSTAELV